MFDIPKEDKWPHFIDPTLDKDGFICEQGNYYAGNHWLLDLWGASHLDNIEYIEQAMNEAVNVSGATLLHLHLHHFTPNGGVSGVAVLAESHISIHTWPERDYIAADIFMCGETHPELAAKVFEKAFSPTKMDITRNRRGEIKRSANN